MQIAQPTSAAFGDNNFVSQIVFEKTSRHLESGGSGIWIRHWRPAATAEAGSISWWGFANWCLIGADEFGALTELEVTALDSQAREKR